MSVDLHSIERCYLAERELTRLVRLIHVRTADGLVKLNVGLGRQRQWVDAIGGAAGGLKASPTGLRDRGGFPDSERRGQS